jgi:hypothetical protein
MRNETWSEELNQWVRDWEAEGAPDDATHPYAWRMLELVRSFPSLRRKVGDDWRWSPMDLARRAFVDGGWSHGELLAAAFVLRVWNTTFPCPPFDVMEALSTWDPAHAEAFLEWARRPWWA